MAKGEAIYNFNKGHTCPRPAESSKKAIHIQSAFFEPGNEQACS